MKKINYYEICNQKLKYLNYSDRTIKSYLFYINQFLENTKVSPTRLTSNDFQSYLDSYNFTSVSQQNQIINAILPNAFQIKNRSLFLYMPILSSNTKTPVISRKLIKNLL